MGIGKLLLNTRKGYEQVVRRYRHRVYGYAYHMLGEAEEAADVTQEVFLRLWRRRETVESGRVLPWLLSVTRNACIDSLRRRKRAQDVMGGSEETLDGYADPAQRADAGAERADFRKQLQQALQTLSEPYRSIVILREIEDLSYAEICGALDLPMTTVKVYLHRGRKMLREAVGVMVDGG